MKILRLLLLALLAAVGAGAQAQRTLVPIVSFENIPVTAATPAPVTAEQVRRAFVEAGEEARWRIDPAGEGVLEGTYVKAAKHTIVVTIRYDAQQYSVLFKGSDNMKQRETQYSSAFTAPSGGETVASSAERKQRALFQDRPESRYVKNDPQAVIHPFYEHWVQDLLERVRLKLRRGA